MQNLEMALLVILIAIFLVLLILAILVVVLIVKILRNIQHVSQRISDVSDDVPEFLKVIGKRIAPVALTTVIGAFLRKARSKR